MLKRFYLLSFALAFLSLGAVAQLEVTDNFQFNNECEQLGTGNQLPPLVIDDNNNANYWKYELTSTVTSNLPNGASLINYSIWRYVYVYIYQSNPGGNVLAQTIQFGPHLTNHGISTWSFDVNDIDLPSGNYEINLGVKYTSATSGNMSVKVLKNGVTECPFQTFANDGEVECNLDRISCFRYQACHDLTIATRLDSRGNTVVGVDIANGTGPYAISWKIQEFKGGANSYIYNNTTTVPYLCNLNIWNEWLYNVTVEDLSTGCIIKSSKVIKCNSVSLSKWRFGSEVEDVKLDLFPNPVTADFVHVKYSLPSETVNAQIEIYNMHGQKVQSTVLDVNSSEMKIRLNELTSGLYIANVVADGKRVANKRIVISH